jgi:hypothetical protein
MKKTIFTMLTLAFIGLSNSYAQVGIGIETPHASATLDLTSNSQGFVPPRMTEAQRNNITTPATGLMVYCSNCGPLPKVSRAVIGLVQFQVLMLSAFSLDGTTPGIL